MKYEFFHKRWNGRLSSSLVVRVLLIGVFMLVAQGCTSVDLSRFETSRTLEKFESLDEVDTFAEERNKAQDKIDAYPSNREFWRNLQFWKKPQVGDDLVEEVIVTGIRASLSRVVSVSDGDDSITNNQELSVDEGGIVKRMGDYMIILRKGVLYSVHVGTQLRKVDVMPVQPDVWQHEAWYDEMLAYDGQIVVIGYGYEIDSSEYLFFELDSSGHFKRGMSQVVLSNDYYSSSNYAARLVDGSLVFLINNIPVLSYDEPGSAVELINVLTSSLDEDGEWLDSYPLFDQHDIYQPILGRKYLSATTVAVCPLSQKPFKCSAKTILGDDVIESYTSSTAYYLWMVGGWGMDIASMSDRGLKSVAWNKETEYEDISLLYRIPLSGSDVGVVQVYGRPIDQFSFKEVDGTLKLLTQRSHGIDVSIGYDPSSFGTIDYLSVPLDVFSDSVTSLPQSSYNFVSQYNESWNLNRFIDEKLLYVENDWDYRNNLSKSDITIFDTDSKSIVNRVGTNSKALQVHPVGKQALIIASEDNGGISFSTLALDSSLGIVDSLVKLGYEEGETRSHAFFYRPDNAGGLFAFPLERDTGGNEHHYSSKAKEDMIYGRIYKNLNIKDVGVLQEGLGNSNSNEDCNGSCYDWYGSSRPIFWGERIFSLMGYELIEGIFINERIQELQRIDISQ